MLLRFLKYLCFLCLLSASSSAFNAMADASVDRVPVEDWGIDLGLGFAAIQNPLNKRGDLKSFILPQWHYYGERFYIENLEMGYSLYEDEQFVIDVIAYPNDDGVLFNADKRAVAFLDVTKFIPKTGRPVPGGTAQLENIKRDFTYMGGLQFFWLTPYVDIRLVRAKDISVGHEGFESQLSIESSYQWNDFKFYWEIGAIRKSANINNYYYGLRAEEVGVRRDAFITLESLENYYLQIAASYRLTSNMSGVISLHHTWMNSDLLFSPLLETDRYLSGFVGVNIHF